MSRHPKVPAREVAPSGPSPARTHAQCPLLPTASMMFQYFVKVVPTVYMKVDGEVSPRGPRLQGTLWCQAREFLQPGK